MINNIILPAAMLSIIMLPHFVCYAECRYAECRGSVQSDPFAVGNTLSQKIPGSVSLKLFTQTINAQFDKLACLSEKATFTLP